MKNLSLLFLNFFISFTIFSQAPYVVEFSKIFGTASCTELGSDIIELPSGQHYIVAGDGCTPGYGWLIKLDENGNKIWDKKGTVGDGYVKTTNDGNFILLKPNIDDSIHVIKSDTLGNVIWQKTIFFPICYNWGRDIIQTADGGYALTGFFSTVSCNSSAPVTYDSFILKLDANGNNQWVKYIGGPLNEMLYAIKQMPDNGYALFGWHGNALGPRWFYLVRTDQNGDTLWTKKYTDAYQSRDNGFGMDLTDDGGFVIIGYSLGYGFSDSTKVYKLDANGNVQWAKKYYRNGGGIFSRIIQSSDGGYAYITIELPAKNGNAISSFVKLDSDGNEEWKTFAPDTGWYFRELEETIDGGFIVTGNTDIYDVTVIKYGKSVPPPGSGATTIPRNPGNKLDTSEYEQPAGVLAQLKKELRVYPNPTKDVLFVQLPSGVKCQVQLLDVQGRAINNVQLTMNNVQLTMDNGQLTVDNGQLTMDNGGPAQLDVSALNKGLYFLKVTTEVEVHTERIVIE